MVTVQNLVVVGLQWGDEGKGKVVDYLSEHFDIVVRFQGGSNAGHTVKTGDSVFKFRIIPTGAVRGLRTVIGNGVVVDPIVLTSEIDQLHSEGIEPDLLISERAHVITPYHLEIDSLQEASKGNHKIGTTKRGIGPAYSDKVQRVGMRMCDALRGRDGPQWRAFEDHARRQIEQAYGSEVSERLSGDLIEFFEAVDRLKPFMGDTGDSLTCAIEKGERVLFEGAQGTLLDVDHGTYPFVTSSNCVSAAAATGSGVSPLSISDVLGVVKAYQTRVGAGPFPTELGDAVGTRLCTVGHEFGTVTGRSRRCGWLDLVALRYAVRLNGAKYLAVTKIDVLSGINPVRVCVRYELNGRETQRVPPDLDTYSRVRPVYEEMSGWGEIESPHSLDALPREMIDYLQFIENYTGARVSIVSLGPDRSETLVVPGVIPCLPRHA